MKRAVSLFVIAATTLGSVLIAQETSAPPKMMRADARPAFEVATIKPSRSGELGGTLRVSPGGVVNLTNFPMMVLIQFASNVPRRQISGGPSWLESERFDVAGKPDLEGTPSVDQVRAMLGKLLEDRLKLSLRHEKRELPAYTLTVAKGGPKLTESTADSNGLPTFLGAGGRAGRNVKNATMAEFASDLQGRVPDRPVMDRTGLGSKRYDFILKWSPDAPATNGAAGTAPDDPDAPPDLFAAIQEQLGLKLESTKAQVDVIVIDHVEKPGEN